MATSSTVTAGTNATDDQYNDLRTDAIRRDTIFQFEVEDVLFVQDEQGGSYVAPYAYTVTKVKVWCETGTCTIRLQKNASNILASQAVSSTATDVTTGFASTAIAENDVLSMDIIGISSGEHVIVQIFATRNL
jgi:hypothetical protein